MTFSTTVRQGSNKSFCSMKATWAFGPATRSPSTKASPSLGAVRPEPILSSVLLPQPLGPISDTTSPSRTEKLTPCTAVSTPRLPLLPKRIVTLRYSRRTTSDMNDRCLLGRLRAYRRPGRLSIVAKTGIADRAGAARRCRPSPARMKEQCMSDRVNRLSRRHLLQGAGGIALGLGVLAGAPARADETITYLFPAPPLLPAFGPIRLAQGKGYFQQA